MITDVRGHLPPVEKPGVPVFRPVTNSTSRWTGVYSGQVMKTDEKEDQKIGRLKVYVYGVYPDVTINSPDDLPWAYPEHPAMLGGKYQQGWSSVPEVGAWVTVRFDCANINKPLYTGTVPGTQYKMKNGDPNNSEPMYGRKDDATAFDKPDKHEPDTHRYVDASTSKIDYDTGLQKDFKPTDNTPASFGDEDRWDISWNKQHENIKYPYNHIFSTGKHTLEFDNTDGYERVSIGHRDGSYISMDWQGDHTTQAKGHMWNSADKSIVNFTEKNNVDVSKQHKVNIAEGDSITTVGGRTEMYFGQTIQPENLDMDFDGDEIISKVQVVPKVSKGSGGNTGSGGSDKDSYMEWSGDAEFKMAQKFTQQVDDKYSLEVKADMNTIVRGSMLTQVDGAEANIQTSGVMNLNATVIKLNCGLSTQPTHKIKGGGAGAGGGGTITQTTDGVTRRIAVGTGWENVPSKKPSNTVDNNTTERNTALLASVVSQVDSPSISKYDSRNKGECDKI